MAKYRHKLNTVEAEQWAPIAVAYSSRNARDGFPGSYGEHPCKRTDSCGRPAAEHCPVRTSLGDEVLCPGDWVVTGYDGISKVYTAQGFNFCYESISFPDETTLEHTLHRWLTSNGSPIGPTGVSPLPDRLADVSNRIEKLKKTIKNLEAELAEEKAKTEDAKKHRLANDKIAQSMRDLIDALRNDGSNL